MKQSSQDPRTFFSSHHHDYVVSSRHARGADLDRLIDGLQPDVSERALDVATGTGHTAFRLAERGAHTIALDLTPEMLAECAKEADRRGLSITTLESPAEKLPLEDQSVDIVTCRRAAHHFVSIAEFLSESHRVLKKGGRLGISDMTVTQAQSKWLDHLETLRDPSHRHALSADEWYLHLIAAHFKHIVLELSEEPMTIEEWLSPVPSDSPEGRQALFFARREDAPEEIIREGQFIKRRILIWAER